MKHYILYGHDGSGNHGCEAIARTTAELLDYKCNIITLVSSRAGEDFHYGLDQLCHIVQRGTHVSPVRKTPGFWKAYYDLKVKHDFSSMDKEAEIQAIGAKKGDVALSIGGDSYCYSDSMRAELIRQHQLFKGKGLKTVFWGCSIESDLLENEQFVQDMKGFDLITTRESISYELLKSINKNTFLTVDSAFNLKKSEVSVPKEFLGKDIVGINASPLIERRNRKDNVVRGNYINLIQTILDETDYTIMLIPHVYWEGNDDRIVLKELYDSFQVTGRVFVCPDSNCCELKGYISKCRFFVGARTHATIAAYSTGVPTLVIGYSTKSRGIAKDLFGTDEGFVIPAQELETNEDLTEGLKWLEKNEQSIRDKLVHIMPQYIERVNKGITSLRML